MAEFYIGLMSGTSLDGIDGVLVSFGAAGNLEIKAHAHCGFTDAEKEELLALNRAGPNELHRAALAANALARRCADVVASLLKQADVAADQVIAIASHGQTVRHRPREFDATGYSIQLNNPALLAELSGIDVIADFRSRDVAAGGQGAPLVPAFHRAVFGRSDSGDACTAVINIGGISNLSVLNANGRTVGFDCGPGNALMDHWCQLHTGAPFDRDGVWAAGGAVHPALLSAMQAEPYFQAPPPKSTGRDLFNANWLSGRLTEARAVKPQDVQTTLTELTAWACAQDVRRFAPEAQRAVICGGGALNTHLMARLAHHLPGQAVLTSAAYDLPVDQVEAAAFAWLARAFVHRQPGNLASVTGALGPRILGALYPAH
jgi:anhydro-N-acetylmuramic acid kinase